MNIIRLTTSAACAVFGVFACAQNLVVNGGFESPSIPADTYESQTPTGWAWGGVGGWLFNGTVNIFPPPQSGQQFADIGNESSYTLSQTFTAVSPGIYVLGWFDSAGHSGGLTTSPYSMTILTGPDQSQTVRSLNFDAYHSTWGVWEGRSTRLSLAAGTYTLQFRAENGPQGLDTLIDTVSLERLPDDDLVATIEVSAVDICWFGRTDQMYQVQYCTDVSTTNWLALGSPVVGTGTNCVTDSVDGLSRKYYRIVRTP